MTVPLAAYIPLKILAGSKWQETFTWWIDKDAAQAKDLSDTWSAVMEFRTRPGGTLLFAATLTINGPTGTVTMTIPASVTVGMNVKRAWYDLELTDSGDADTPIRVMYGSAEIGAEVTTS